MKSHMAATVVKVYVYAYMLMYVSVLIYKQDLKTEMIFLSLEYYCKRKFLSCLVP